MVVQHDEYGWRGRPKESLAGQLNDHIDSVFTNQALSQFVLGHIEKRTREHQNHSPIS